MHHKYLKYVCRNMLNFIIVPHEIFAIHRHAMNKLGQFIADPGPGSLNLVNFIGQYECYQPVGKCIWAPLLSCKPDKTRLKDSRKTLPEGNYLNLVCWIEN